MINQDMYECVRGFGAVASGENMMRIAIQEAIDSRKVGEDFIQVPQVTHETYYVPFDVVSIAIGYPIFDGLERYLQKVIDV